MGKEQDKKKSSEEYRSRISKLKNVYQTPYFLIYFCNESTLDMALKTLCKSSDDDK